MVADAARGPDKKSRGEDSHSGITARGPDKTSRGEDKHSGITYILHTKQELTTSMPRKQTRKISKHTLAKIIPVSKTTTQTVPSPLGGRTQRTREVLIASGSRHAKNEIYSTNEGKRECNVVSNTRDTRTTTTQCTEMCTHLQCLYLNSSFVRLGLLH